MTEIDFALSQTNTTDQIELVGTVLWNKVKLIKHFTNLSEAERHFVYIDIFESELNNGGLFHFFYNTSGAYAHEVLDAFNAVDANNSGTLYNNALYLFPELPIPKDIFVRRQFMNEISKNVKAAWLDLEDQFIASNEDLVLLLVDYIKKHKTDFEY